MCPAAVGPSINPTAWTMQGNPILLAKAQPAGAAAGQVRQVTTRFAPSQKDVARIPAVTKKPGSSQKSAAIEAQDYGYMEYASTHESYYIHQWHVYIRICVAYAWSPHFADASEHN